MHRKPRHNSILNQFLSGFTKLSPDNDMDLEHDIQYSGDTGHSGDIFVILYRRTLGIL